MLATPLQNLFYGLPADRRDFLRRAQLESPSSVARTTLHGLLERSALVRMSRIPTLRQPHGRGRQRLRRYQVLQGFIKTLPAPYSPMILMRDRGAAQRETFNQVLLGVLNALADRLGNFACFTNAETNGTFSIAYHDERSKLEDPAALDGLTYTVDRDYVRSFMNP